MEPIYLDYINTTPLLPEAWSAMQPFYQNQRGTLQSFHRYGLSARRALSSARQQLAAFINAQREEEIIFTSSGTEALNLALKGFALENSSRGRHIITTAIEHPALLESARWLKSQGFHISEIPVNSIGQIDLDLLMQAITDQTILMAFHAGHPDLGTLQSIDKIADISTTKNIALLIDGNTAAGWTPLDVQRLPISLLTLSAHRFYGPKGCGALYCRRGVALAPLIQGGKQEQGLRAGTENLPAIVGTGVAAEIAKKELAQRMEHTYQRQQQFLTGLGSRLLDWRLNGPLPGPERLPHHLSISLTGVEGEALVLRGDLQGLAFHSGASCLSRALKIAPALTAIGLPERLALGTVLFGFGRETTPEEVETALKIFPAVVQKIRTIMGSSIAP